jgi:hypothetical protein
MVRRYGGQRDRARAWGMRLFVEHLAWYCVVVWLGFVVAFFLVLNLLTHNLWSNPDGYQLAFHGARSTGVVTNVDVSNHGSCSFSYVVDGKTYESGDVGCGADYQVGQTLPITYAWSDPSIAVSDDGDSALTSFFELTGFILVASALFTLSVVGRVRRQQKKEKWQGL